MDSPHRLEKAPYVMGMPLKIGVMGGASGEIEKEHLDKAHRLGRGIGERGCVLITGACPGLPLAAACGAKQNGGYVVGISPALSLDEHVTKYGSPVEFHDVLIYTGSGLMGREVVNIRSSDIVVFIGGRTGTLGELAIAYDEGKLIGVLTGTGGISDMVSGILKVCDKNTGAKVVYSGDPERLIEEVIRVYREEHHRHPSHFSSAIAWGDVNPKPGTERDVVCGMWILPQLAIAERQLEDKTYRFCSKGCAERFAADPSRYLSKNKEA